jgi:hypothetical protein
MSLRTSAAQRVSYATTRMTCASKRGDCKSAPALGATRSSECALQAQAIRACSGHAP